MFMKGQVNICFGLLKNLVRFHPKFMICAMTEFSFSFFFLDWNVPRSIPLTVFTFLKLFDLLECEDM